MIIFVSVETLLFCLSLDVFFVRNGNVEEQKVEKITLEKLIIFLTINYDKSQHPHLHCFKGAKTFIKFIGHLRILIKSINCLNLCKQ